MKIMFLVDTYYPLQDGVQMVTQYLAEGLAVEHDVLVITSLRDGMPRNIDYNGVKIERIRAKRNRYTMYMSGERALLKKRICEYTPDVLIVVSHSTWAFDWLRGRLNKYPGKKILYTHGIKFEQECHILDLIKKIKLRRQILADLMGIYIQWYWQKYKNSLPQSVSEYDKVIYLYDKDTLYEYIKSYGIENGMVIENAVEDVFFQRKAYLPDNTKQLTFINVSSFVERKNQKLVLESFYEAQIDNAKLILIGSHNTTYYTELIQLNNDLEKKYSIKVPKVDILCGLPRKDILKIYQGADVYVSASSWEAMSISLCEAAASGMTILTTDVGHVSCIPGVFLCETKEDFINNMRLVYQQPELRAERGKMAYDYAELHYRISDKVNELERCLVELVNGDT